LLSFHALNEQLKLPSSKEHEFLSTSEKLCKTDNY
jgi:hypothetical protein